MEALNLKFDESFHNDRRKMAFCASIENKNKNIYLILEDRWSPIHFDEVGIKFPFAAWR
jgi:hypothetical protein